MNNSDKLTKCYMLDTSAILDDPYNIFRLSDGGENQVYINNVVYSEMNNKKKDNKSDAGQNAREFFRLINDKPLKILTQSEYPECIKEIFDEKGKKQGDKVIQFEINRDGDVVLLYMISRAQFIVAGTKLEEVEENDLKIAEVALAYKMTLVTNDAGLHMHMQMNEGRSEFLLNDAIESPDAMNFETEYKFLKSETEGFSTAQYVNYFTNHPDFAAAKNFTQFTLTEIDRNTETEETYETGKQLWAVKRMGIIDIIDQDPAKKYMKDTHVKYQNKEQAMYHMILTSEDAKVTVVSGATGSGKTLLALNAGIQLMKDGQIDGIVYTRNTVTSNDPESELGFRKGGEDQKLGYFMLPLYSAVNVLIESGKKKAGKALENQVKFAGDTNSINKENATELFMKEHCIEIVDIAHLRGVTISKKMVIIDESQNMTTSSMKLIGTRMGEEARLVIMGDSGQIDHPYLTKKRNALAKMLSIALKDPFVAGIKLKRTVRSDLAEWFDQAL